MSRRLAKASGPLVALLLIASLAGCVVNPVTGKKEFNIISEAMEIEMGKSTDVSIREEYGIYDDPALNAYVENLGKQMAPITHRPQLPYHFAVLDTPVENAFAAPGGYIYITRGMLAIMDDEAAMAAIIGHELGHVNARHTARAMSRQLLLMGGVIVASALSEDLQKIAPFAMVGLQVLFLKFSRDDEYQADSLGVQYSRKIGYAPGRVVPLFTTFLRMEKAGGGPRLPNFLSTHPLSERRIEEINKMLEPGDASLRVARPEFLKRIDGLVYGDNPRQGYVEAGAFYHPDLQFALQIPSGWKYQNSPKQFIMAPDDEKAAVFLSTETTNKDLGVYLQEQLTAFKDSQVKEMSRSPLRINGLNAMRGVYDVRPKPQEGQEPTGTPMSVDIHCIRKGGQVFTFVGYASESDFPKYGAAINASIRSFQPLTDPAKLNRKPMRIGLQTARSGETFRQTLQRLSAPEKQWKALEMMNGLALDQAVGANRAVKILR
jgi:predicted Zn-dependent protease